MEVVGELREIFIKVLKDFGTEFEEIQKIMSGDGFYYFAILDGQKVVHAQIFDYCEGGYWKPKRTQIHFAKSLVQNKGFGRMAHQCIEWWSNLNGSHNIVLAAQFDPENKELQKVAYWKTFDFETSRLSMRESAKVREENI